MIASEILEQFNLQTDDQSSLSDTESLALLNRVLRKIYNTRAWAFLEKTHSATVSNKEFALPSDYQYIVETYDDGGGAPAPYLFQDTQLIRVIPFTEKRNYTRGDTDPNIQYAYIDLRQDKVVILSSAYDGLTVEMDYIYSPTDLTTSGSPAFPSRFHSIVPHLMAYEFDIIDQGEKGMSYAGENNSLANTYLEDMIYWDTVHKTYGERV